MSLVQSHWSMKLTRVNAPLAVQSNLTSTVCKQFCVVSSLWQ
jgi:hypothetical protein